MLILICCALLLALAAGFLVFKGRFGRSGIVWTARMGDDD